MNKEEESENLLMAISGVLIGIGLIFIGIFRLTNPDFVMLQPLKSSFDNIMAFPILGDMLKLLWGFPEGMLIFGVVFVTAGGITIYSFRRAQ